MRRLRIIYRLGVKELMSLRADPVLLLLIVYTFTIAIYSVATGAKTDVENAAVGVVDEDRSQLSRRLVDALRPPFFQSPVMLTTQEVDQALDRGRFSFVLDIPPDFQSDLLAGRRPALQLDVDATAMSQAGNGAGYIASIVAQETAAFVNAPASDPAVALTLRTRFNPNLQSSWFMALMQVINNVTLLAIVLSGAALIREREHGTIEHLLVMPLAASDIMCAKLWANGLVIVGAATLSLILVVRWLLGIPIPGSIPLFVAATVIYLFSVSSLGILLATVARSMPQFGLLAIPVFIIMNLLSGGTTPLESMPEAMQMVMRLSPSTHYVALAQSILNRGAGLDTIWPSLAVVAGLGAVFFILALARFRRALALAQG